MLGSLQCLSVSSISHSSSRACCINDELLVFHELLMDEASSLNQQISTLSVCVCVWVHTLCVCVCVQHVLVRVCVCVCVTMCNIGL